MLMLYEPICHSFSRQEQIILTVEHMAARPSVRGETTRMPWKRRVMRIGIKVLDHLLPTYADHLTLKAFLNARQKRDRNYQERLPEGARPLALDHHGHALKAWAWGTRGQSVLLVHGWEGHAGQMIPFVTPLLRAGMRVVTFDFPGHGLSPQGATDMVDMGQIIQRVIEAHGPFEAIIAHSGGATAAAHMLAREVQLQPQKLVMIAPMRDLAQHLEIYAQLAQISPRRVARLHRQVR
jgi:alpha-beta hydrolase superfamily lysophospholipase